MKPHEERVLNEREELRAKWLALRAFIVSESFPSLTERERFLLGKQEQYMGLYLDILSTRIAEFTK